MPSSCDQRSCVNNLRPGGVDAPRTQGPAKNAPLSGGLSHNIDFRSPEMFLMTFVLGSSGRE